MNKDKIISEYKKIRTKIERNRSKGYSTENLERALEKIKDQAKEKKIRIKDYAY